MRRKTVRVVEVCSSDVIIINTDRILKVAEENVILKNVRIALGNDIGILIVTEDFSVDILRMKSRI